MGLRLLILSGVIYLIYILPQKFFSLDYFNINKVSVTTENSKMLQPELTKLSQKIYNKNSIYFDYNEIKNIIKKDVRVEEAEVYEGALGEVTIDVKEKDLSYYAVIGKNIYLVDKNGIIFGYMNEKKIQDLPIIVAKEENEIKEITRYLNSIFQAEKTKNISQVYKNDDKEYVIVLIDGGKFKVNKTVDEEKYRIATQLYFKMSKERKIDYVDLRFDDYIIKYLGDEKDEKRDKKSST